jgi:Alginate export
MQIDAIGNAGCSGFFGMRESAPATAPVTAVIAATAIFATLAIAIPAAARSAEVDGTQDGNAPPLKPTTLRYDEDYSYLRDPAKRTGAWWERFKYIPLDANGNAYLTLGMELRFREEAYRNFNWGELPTNGYQWYRALPYADLHLGPNLRLFGQLIGAWVTDKVTVGGIDETGFEPLQAFADIKLPLASGTDLTLRGGRQLMSYGTERLISLRYGPNVLRSFDTALASVTTDAWRVDAFFAQPVQNMVGSFNDRFDLGSWRRSAPRQGLISTTSDIGTAPQNSIKGVERNCGTPSVVVFSVPRRAGTGISKAWRSSVTSITEISALGRLLPIQATRSPL